MSESIACESKRGAIQGGLMAWLVCLSGGLFFLYEFFQLNLFDVINPELRVDFQLNAMQLSELSSSYVLANILFLLPAGFLLDRFSTRRVIILAMLLCVFGTAGFACSTQFVWAFVFHFLTGIGNAFCFLSCVVLISRWFPTSRQAFLIGCVVTMAFLGGVLAHTPLAYLTAYYGWRNALWMDVGLGVVIVLWLLVVLRDRPAALNNNPERSLPPKNQFMSLMLNPQNGLAGLYTACMNLPIMVLCALWGASYLDHVHHLPVITASNVVSLILVGSMLGCPLAGWLSDRLGRRKPLMVLGALGTLLLMIPFFLTISLSWGELSILFFALGFFTSTQVIGYAVVAESNPSYSTGLATGIASVVIMVGGGLGQVLFGWLLRAHAGVVEVERMVDYQFAMWLFPVAMMLALLAIAFMRETYCRRLDKDE